MNDNGVYRTALATQGLLKTDICNFDWAGQS